jgi:Xaa-Pro aminopeptidase
VNDPVFPPRGFSEDEYAKRTRNAQQLMASLRIDALLLCTEAEVRYFSGFNSQFWESPSRPWYLVIPTEGKPIAVIPEIGVAGMHQTWIEDIRSWPAPQPADDGISLLGVLLRDVCCRHGRFGLPMGYETTLRMPLVAFNDLREQTRAIELVDGSQIVHRLRSIKSEAEIDKIRAVCGITSAGFEHLPGLASAGDSERDICRQFAIDLRRRGADASPYLIAASGYGGYDNIIMGPTDRRLETGDVLIIDTGTTFDGYFCDFDRNFAFGDSTDEVKRAYEVVYEATKAGIDAARPGATNAQLHDVMWEILKDGGALGNDVGRLGHGLGMQLTEGASNMSGDDTVLEPGMVITIEPGMAFAPGKLMVHEENIVIREGQAELLTRRAAPELPCIR